MFRVVARFLVSGLIPVAAVPAAFSQSVSFTHSPVAEVSTLHADFNSDGREDFVVQNQNGCPQFGLVLSNGDGTYGAAVCYTTPGAGPGPIAIGDFNGDGYPDLIVGDGNSAKFYEYLGSKNGTLHLQATFVTATSPIAFAAADMNHDGKMDLLYTDCLYCNPNLHVWFGNGNGGFTVGPTTPLSTDATSLTVGDFDGDGHADVVAQQGWRQSRNLSWHAN